MHRPMERNHYLDIYKGIGIFLVLIGHTYSGTMNGPLYSFHMPMFFFISGFLFSPDKYPTLGTMIKRKFRTLIKPHLFFYLFSYLYFILVEKHTGTAIQLTTEWWRPLIGALLGTNAFNAMGHNAPLWFIPCLFSVEVLFYIFKRRKHPIIYILLGTVFSFCYSYFKLPALPMMFNVALAVLPFFVIGFYLKNINLDISTIQKIAWGGTLVISSALLYIFFRNHVNCAKGIYGNYILFYYQGIALTIPLLYLSYQIGKNSIIEYIGINSLVIFALHLPVNRAAMLLGAKLMQVSKSDFSHQLLICILTDCVILTVLIPIIYIYNKYIKKRLSK